MVILILPTFIPVFRCVSVSTINSCVFSSQYLCSLSSSVEFLFSSNLPTQFVGMLTYFQDKNTYGLVQRIAASQSSSLYVHRRIRLYQPIHSLFGRRVQHLCTQDQLYPTEFACHKIKGSVKKRCLVVLCFHHVIVLKTFL